MDFNTRSCSFPIVSSSFQVNRYFLHFSPRAINIPRKNLLSIFRKRRMVFNSTLLRRGYSNMRSRSSSNFWSIPPRCYRIMTCLELLKWYAKFLNPYWQMPASSIRNFSKFQFSGIMLRIYYST